MGGCILSFQMEVQNSSLIWGLLISATRWRLPATLLKVSPFFFFWPACNCPSVSLIRGLHSPFFPSLMTSHSVNPIWKMLSSPLCCVLSCSVTQSGSTLCESMDCSLPGSSVHGIFPARILEWVAIYFSRGSLRPKDWTRVSYTAYIAGIFFTNEPPGNPFKKWSTRKIIKKKKKEIRRPAWPRSC